MSIRILSIKVAAVTLATCLAYMPAAHATGFYYGHQAPQVQTFNYNRGDRGHRGFNRNGWNRGQQSYQNRGFRGPRYDRFDQRFNQRGFKQHGFEHRGKRNFKQRSPGYYRDRSGTLYYYGR